MNIRHTLLAGCLVLASIACAAGPHDNPGQEHNNNAQSAFSFAFMGDMPYKPYNEPKFERLVAEVNADPRIQFVMHAGDIKSGSELCSDELITHRFNMYQQFKVPFVYTPGDNEWTDCHRTNNGPYDPLDRLAFVRNLFFPDPNYTTGGRKMPVHTQATESGYSTYVENVWFERNDVVFATAHVIGSNNDLKPWTGKNDDVSQFGEVAGSGVLSQAHQDEYKYRNLADLAWLDTVFAAAENAKGLFLIMQANPDFETFDPAAGNPDPNAVPDPSTPGFQNFLVKFYEKSKEYGKPVVIAQGDSHVLLIDNPFDEESPDKFDPPVMNVTRVQTFGQDNIHWIEVIVDPKSDNVFTFVPHIIKANVQ